MLYEYVFSGIFDRRGITGITGTSQIQPTSFFAHRDAIIISLINAMEKTLR
jgi:hypothetical protein